MPVKNKRPMIITIPYSRMAFAFLIIASFPLLRQYLNSPTRRCAGTDGLRSQSINCRRIGRLAIILPSARTDIIRVRVGINIRGVNDISARVNRGSEFELAHIAPIPGTVTVSIFTFDSFRKHLEFFSFGKAKLRAPAAVSD